MRINISNINVRFLKNYLNKNIKYPITIKRGDTYV